VQRRFSTVELGKGNGEKIPDRMSYKATKPGLNLQPVPEGDECLWYGLDYG